MKIGFTLIELLVVIVVIGILATLAVTHFGSAREQAFDKMAQADLKLIRAAERIFNMENNSYYQSAVASPASITDINANLRLSLNDTATRQWDYRTWAVNVAPRNSCAQATRFNGPDARTWRIRIRPGQAGDEEEPVRDGTCP